MLPKVSLRFSMLLYQEYEPRYVLRSHVQCFWSFVADPPDNPNVDHRVLPDGCIDIVFQARSVDEGAQCNLRAVGTMTRFIEAEAVPITLGVRFRPGMARRFLALPAAELTDLQVDLCELWGDDGKRLQDQMRRPRSVLTRLGLLESALLRRLGPGDEDRRVVAAVQQVTHAGGRVCLPDVADRIGLSERQLRRGFEDAVGLSPKRFARVMRFRVLLDVVRAARDARLGNARFDWASTAIDCGYYDQAHMINEFRDLTGQTPARYLTGVRS